MMGNKPGTKRIILNAILGSTYCNFENYQEELHKRKNVEGSINGNAIPPTLGHVLIAAIGFYAGTTTHCKSNLSRV
jgi:hypothetical protein